MFQYSFWHQLNRLWLDIIGRTAADILATAARKAADNTDGHVVITENLAAQPHARQATSRKHLLLSNGHLVGLASQELDPASRATSVTAASMELVYSSLIFEGQHETLALPHLEFTYDINS
jgi:hypothetical protein